MAASSRPLWFRLVRGTVLSVLALALSLLVAAWWLLATPSGMRWLLGSALPYAQEHMPSHLQLDIEGIDAETLADVRIARLTLSDGEGTWLEAERLVLSWAPSALWKGMLLAEEVSAGHIRFLRPPVTEPEPETGLQEQVDAVVETLESLPGTLRGISLPPLRIHTLRVDELAVDSGLVDMPSRFRFTGTMDLPARPARLEMALRSLSGVSTTADASLSGTPSALMLEVDWREESGGLLGSLLLAQPAPFSLSLDSALEDDTIATRVAAAAGEEPLLQAELRLPLKGKAQFDWQATLPKPPLIAALEDFPTAIEASGSLREDAVRLLAQTERIILGGNQFRNATAEAELRLDEGSPPFALEATARADMAQPQQEPLPLSLVLRAEGDAETWDLTMLNASAGADMTATANGRLRLADGAGKLEGTLALPQLDARYHAQAENLWDTPQATAKLVLETLKHPLPAPLDAAVVLPVVLRAETADNGTATPDVELALESANINGSGTLYPAAASGNPLAVAEVTVEGLPLPLTLSARHMPSGSGQVELRSDALRLAADYALAEERLALSPILLDGGSDLQLSGNVTLHTDKGLASGRISGHVRSASPLNGLGLDLPAITASEGKTDVALSFPGDTQRVKAGFTSGNVRMDGQHAAADIRLESDIRLPAGKAPELDTSVTVTDASLPVPLDKATLSAKGTLDKLDLRLRAGHEATGTRATAVAALALDDVLTLTVDRATRLERQGSVLTLARAFTLHHGSGEIALRGLRARLNDIGSIDADFSLTPEKADGKATIRDLPLKALPFGALASMQGELKGDLSLSGTADNPSLLLTMSAHGLQNNYPTLTRLREQPLDARLRTELAQRKLAVRFTADAPDAESSAAFSVDMPVDVSLAPDDLRFAAGDTFEARLRADMILGPFLPLFLPDGVYGTGHLIADLAARGAWEKPAVTGSVDLHSGIIEILQTGTLLKDITFKAAAAGNRITLSGGSATDGDKGRLTFGGSVNLTPELPMNAATEVRKFVVMRHTNATATLSGDASLKGDLSDALFKGAWHVDGARITIQPTGASDVPEIRVIEVSSLDDPLETPEMIEMSDEERKQAIEKRRRERPFANNLKLDVGIAAENQIFLDGFGLTAELKGKVAIGGTAARPTLGGQMETVRGRWEFFGRTFVITRGRAILSENNLTAPLIDLRAEVEAANITAIAQITGTTNRPVIEFTSIPPLPQDEIVSRVMFGSSLNSISPYQALQLADMLRTISGKGGGTSPLGKLQSTLGIDDLRVKNGSSAEDVTVGVGKYLQENIYLEVEGGAGENSGKVSVEVDLTPRISVGTETRQNADSAVRFNYKFDY